MTIKQEVRHMSLFVTDIEELVSSEHAYRKILKLIDFSWLTRELRDCYSDLGRAGYPVESGFKALLLQYMEDLSNREAERFLQENLAGKLFCGFGIKDKTPDHTYFVVLRNRIGLERLATLFNKVRDMLKKQNVIR